MYSTNMFFSISMGSVVLLLLCLNEWRPRACLNIVECYTTSHGLRGVVHATIGGAEEVFYDGGILLKPGVRVSLASGLHPGGITTIHRMRRMSLEECLQGYQVPMYDHLLFTIGGDGCFVYTSSHCSLLTVTVVCKLVHQGPAEKTGVGTTVYQNVLRAWSLASVRWGRAEFAIHCLVQQPARP